METLQPYLSYLGIGAVIVGVIALLLWLGFSAMLSAARIRSAGWGTNSADRYLTSYAMVSTNSAPVIDGYSIASYIFFTVEISQLLLTRLSKKVQPFQISGSNEPSNGNSYL